MIYETANLYRKIVTTAKVILVDEKEVTTFRYRQKVADKIREIIDALRSCTGEIA